MLLWVSCTTESWKNSIQSGWVSNGSLRNWPCFLKKRNNWIFQQMEKAMGWKQGQVQIQSSYSLKRQRWPFPRSCPNGLGPRLCRPFPSQRYLQTSHSLHPPYLYMLLPWRKYRCFRISSEHYTQCRTSIPFKKHIELFFAAKHLWSRVNLSVSYLIYSCAHWTL